MSPKQLTSIEDYIKYLELEKTPFFNNDLYNQKLKLFRSFLSTKLKFVPNNYYVYLAVIFGFPFALPSPFNQNLT